MTRLKIRTCHGPRNIRPNGTVVSYRAICNSTNVKIVQPSPDWITYYCLDCHYTNVEAAERPDQLKYELEQLFNNAENTFGALGMEAPSDMPPEVRTMFVEKHD